MTGKHFGWHKAWHRDGSRLVHISGMAFIVERGVDDGQPYTDINADESTLAEFQAFELARGVLLKDLTARLMRLNKEAAEFWAFALQKEAYDARMAAKRAGKPLGGSA